MSSYRHPIDRMGVKHSYADCPNCRSSVAVTKAGTLFNHKRVVGPGGNGRMYLEPCPGSHCKIREG